MTIPFEFLKAAGALQVYGFPDRPAANQPEGRGGACRRGRAVRLGIHHHGGGHWLGNSPALRWVSSQSSARFGLCLDTAWALDSGEDPVAMIMEFGPRVHLLHHVFLSKSMARNQQVSSANMG